MIVCEGQIPAFYYSPLLGVTPARGLAKRRRFRLNALDGLFLNQGPYRGGDSTLSKPCQTSCLPVIDPGWGVGGRTRLNAISVLTFIELSALLQSFYPREPEY